MDEINSRTLRPSRGVDNALADPDLVADMPADFDLGGALNNYRSGSLATDSSIKDLRSPVDPASAAILGGDDRGAAAANGSKPRVDVYRPATDAAPSTEKKSNPWLFVAIGLAAVLALGGMK